MSATSRIKGALVGAVGAALRNRLATRALAPVLSGYQILTYHRVLPKADPLAMAAVDLAAFTEQMKLLKACYNVISLDQLLAGLDGGNLVPGAICVTFDDGYRDNFEVAFPVLQALGIPATLFVATDFIGGRGILWYDRVLQAFKDTRRSEFSLPEAGIASQPLQGYVGTHPAYRVLEWLKAFPPADRNRKIESVFAALTLDGEPRCDLMLDWDQIRTMRDAGVVFGPHTKSHPILSTVGPEENEAEILGSRQVLEAEVGRPARHFAYPNGRRGDYNDSSKAALKKGGFATALTTNPGVNPPGQDRYEIRRSQPWESSINRMHGRMVLEKALG